MKIMKSKISTLTIILIVLSLASLYLTYNSYNYWQYESNTYSDMVYAEPTESVISDEDWTRLYNNELNTYVLLKNSEEFTGRLDGDRENMYLSYSLYARNQYFINRLGAILFIILSIFSWKMDNPKKKD